MCVCVRERGGGLREREVGVERERLRERLREGGGHKGGGLRERETE